MILARVTGTVVATQKNPEFEGYKLLLVHPIDLDGERIKSSFLAVDIVDAGVGDQVLVLDEGGSTRIVLRNDGMPLRNVVIAVVDNMEVHREFLE